MRDRKNHINALNNIAFILFLNWLQCWNLIRLIGCANKSLCSFLLNTRHLVNIDCSLRTSYCEVIRIFKRRDGIDLLSTLDLHSTMRSNISFNVFGHPYLYVTVNFTSCYKYLGIVSYCQSIDCIFMLKEGRDQSAWRPPLIEFTLHVAQRVVISICRINRKLGCFRRY